MGGGGAFLVIGILAALLERQKSGQGQVVDAAILDGTVSQLAIILGLRAGGFWGHSRGGNTLDGGAPFYRTYRCLDGKYVAVAALEAKFFAALVQGLDLDAAQHLPRQNDRTHWPALQRALEAAFAAKTRDEWAAHFGATDACVVPVLDFDEAAKHPHNTARSTFLEKDGALHPPAAPRFSRSIATMAAHNAAGEGGADAIREWGVV
jgi:alpha-methylacyl-CoA racemase